MKMKSIRKMSFSNRCFYVFNSLFWIMILFFVLYPIYLVCICSISDPDAILEGKVIWRPVDISFIGYEEVFKNTQLWISYANSILYTVAGVAISIIVTLTAAYAVSRRKFPGKAAINLFFVIPMFFGGGLIPTFLITKNIGLYDTRLILILSGCVSVWNLMVARTYIQSTIPEELYEASVLDGANHFQYFFKVVLPLSKSIVAVLAVYYGVGKWNDYFTGLIYIRNEKLLPLQTVLRDILATLQTASVNITFLDEANMIANAEAIRTAHVVKYCVIVVSSIPAVFLYSLMQKYFEKGVMIGSLKG